MPQYQTYQKRLQKTFKPEAAYWRQAWLAKAAFQEPIGSSKRL
jgi:hypothetical protein